MIYYKLYKYSRILGDSDAKLGTTAQICVGSRGNLGGECNWADLRQLSGRRSGCACGCVGTRIVGGDCGTTG